MDIALGVFVGVVVLLIIILVLFEFRLRKPDTLLLAESKGQIRSRTGPIYPRHFSLPLARTTSPIQQTIEATAVGNLEVRIKLVGTVAPSIDHIQALVRIGGWNEGAVTHVAEEVEMMLQGLVKEYIEGCEIHALSSTSILNHLNERSLLILEKFGVELITLSVQTLEPTDPEIGEALRQQERARLLEQTERLNHQARASAAKAKILADEEISQMEHDLALKKAEMKKTILEQEATLTQQSLEDELKRNRMRLAFEAEELEVLKSSPELLMLTPQAARLAEASQNLKNARTIVSFTPQEFAQGSELLEIFHNLLQAALEKKESPQ
jgi:hypothetical protein